MQISLFYAFRSQYRAWRELTNKQTLLQPTSALVEGGRTACGPLSSKHSMSATQLIPTTPQGGECHYPRFVGEETVDGAGLVSGHPVIQ